MAFFVKRPVRVQAIQWTPNDNDDEMRLLLGDDLLYFQHEADQAFRMAIQTLEGPMYASPGDWIIEGIRGEHYACKPDIFAETYVGAE